MAYPRRIYLSRERIREADELPVIASRIIGEGADNT